MPKAISYIRFSTGKQAKGNSEERQDEAVTQWLVQHPEYTRYDKPFKDRGKSGYSGEHIKQGGGWAKILVAVKQGDFQPGDCILVEAIDRTGRMHTGDMLGDLILPILRSGVSIITLDDGNEYSNDSINTAHMHLLVARIQAAHMFSKQLSERTKASYVIRREKAKNGKEVKRHTPVWLNTDGTHKPHIVPHIIEVFDLYISGVGKHTIANRLRATGIDEFKTCVGSTVGKWINNKAAIGYWEGKNGNKDIPGVYTPIVTPEVFLQAEKRQDDAKTTPKSYTTKNFLQGLVKCGTCGANYSFHRKDGKLQNMRCRKHHLHGNDICTNNETIPYQVVHYVYLQTASAWIDRALKVIQLTENDKQKLTLNAERETLSVAIQNLVRLSAMGPSGELEAQYKLAIERRTAIDSELDILNRKPDDVIESKSGSIFLGYEATLEHDRLAFNDPVQLSALLKQAGYSITLQPGRKLYLPDSDTPWLYTGVARKGNTTLGYRIQDDEWEHTISNVIPEAVDVQAYENKPDGELRHIADRSYKHVKSSTLLNQTGIPNTKGMAVEKFESANAAMQHLMSEVEPDTNK